MGASTLLKDSLEVFSNENMLKKVGNPIPMLYVNPYISEFLDDINQNTTVEVLGRYIPY
jgi:hypothetical protein